MNQHLHLSPASHPPVHARARPLPVRKDRSADTRNKATKRPSLWRQPARIESGIALSHDERNSTLRWDALSADLLGDDDAMYFSFLLLPEIDADGQEISSPPPAAIPHPAEPGGTQGGADPGSERERN